MISTSDSYFENVTNSNNPHFYQYHRGLDELKNKIEFSLRVGGNPFDDYLSSMSIQDKSRLLSALVQNNSAEIVKFLYKPIETIYPEIAANPEALKYITELSAHDDKGNWLSGSVQAIIESMLYDKDNITQALIIQNAMQHIPDTEFSIQAKYELAHVINSNVVGAIDALAYSSQLNVLDKNKYSGNITKNEYNLICKNKSLDTSEYIITTLGALQTATSGNAEAAEDLKKISRMYDKLTYTIAIDEIKAFCEKYPVSDDLKKNIIDKSAQCVKPNINENYIRRFYENRVVQLGVGDIDLVKANKVLMAISGVGASHLSEISNIATASMMKKEKHFFDRYHQLTKQSPSYQSRDRNEKKGTLSMRGELEGKSGNSIWSNNPGVMTSNQPNFADETTDFSLRNRVPDRNVAVGLKNPIDARNFSAYAASTSGHAIYLVALVEDYMKKHQSDPDLESDVNNYIKAFISSYVHSGFHSYLEVVHVLNDPAIKKIFHDNNVKLDLSWKSNVVEQATKDTQEYAKTVCLKKTLSAELKALQKPITDTQLKINTLAYKTMVEQITSIKTELNYYRKKQSLIKSKHSQKNRMCTKAIAELNILERELANPNVDLRKIDKKCRDIVNELTNNNLKADKTGGKLGKTISEITEIIGYNKQLIDRFQAQQNENTLIKKVDSKLNIHIAQSPRLR